MLVRMEERISQPMARQEHIWEDHNGVAPGLHAESSKLDRVANITRRRWLWHIDSERLPVPTPSLNTRRTPDVTGPDVYRKHVCGGGGARGTVLDG